jgi:hypothetical protein
MNDSAILGVKAALDKFDNTTQPMAAHIIRLYLEIKYASNYGEDPFCVAWGKPATARNKHTAISFYHTVEMHIDRSRIEVRCVRPQTSIQVFIKQIQLLQSRLNYLSRIKEKIPLAPAVRTAAVLNPNGVHKLTPPVDPQEAIKAFYQYVTESGESWADHREYLWPDWLQPGGEVEKFESTLQQVTSVTCRIILAN